MKSLVAVFAHPDDEVFGPGGMIAIEAKRRDVFIICVTNGDAGKNSSSQTKELGELRREELLESAKVLGIKKVFFLHYKDGTLSNNLYHEIAEKVQKIIKEIRPETLVTYEQRGISGHIDHIAVSMITSYVFERSHFVEELWYYCLSEKQRTFYKPYYIYFPPGYKDAEISKAVNIIPVWDQKVEAMHKHQSQKHDVESLLGIFMKGSSEEYFIVNKQKKESDPV